MTWNPALPRYSLTMPARRGSSSIRRTRSATRVHQAMLLIGACPFSENRFPLFRGHALTTMPARPPPAECRPVGDFPALLGAQHLGRIGQRLRDPLARGFRQADLLGAQALDGSTIDGRSGQER